jgi:hypothetical protein
MPADAPTERPDLRTDEPTNDALRQAMDIVLNTAAQIVRCEPFHGTDSDNVSDRTIENFGRLGTRLMEARETIRAEVERLRAAAPASDDDEVTGG